jgi:hypothetical protein
MRSPNGWKPVPSRCVGAASPAEMGSVIEGSDGAADGGGTSGGTSRSTCGATRGGPPVRGASIEEMLDAAPERLFGVDVAKVHAALQKGVRHDDVLGVMTELWSGHRYLAPASTKEGGKLGRIAIVSYRVAGAPTDDFAFDVHSFLTVVHAAKVRRCASPPLGPAGPKLKRRRLRS